MDGLTLVIGGARAGKTSFALSLAHAAPGPVTYVATAEAGDGEMAARIVRHRAERPPHWRTVEAPLDPVAALIAEPVSGLVLLDCLTMLVSNILLAHLPAAEFTAAAGDAAEAATLAAVRRLLDWREQAGAALVVVSNEVGLGIVPVSPLARLYRDTLGRANQLVAARAARVYLVVAGLALDLKAAGALPFDRVAAKP